MEQDAQTLKPQLLPNSSLGNAKGAHELDQALSELKKLGYTKGS